MLQWSDINERAVQLAIDNAKLNGFNECYVMVKSDLFEGLGGMKFHSIVTNPPIRAGKAVVHRIFDEAYEHLA